jgi:hypothetical protein
MYDMKTFRFGRGKHDSREQGMCLLEAVAYLAGEPHTDRPACADPVITRLGHFVNDSASDSQRQELLGDLPWRIIGTKSTPQVECKRSFMAADWAMGYLCGLLFPTRHQTRTKYILSGVPKYILYGGKLPELVSVAMPSHFDEACDAAQQAMLFSAMGQAWTSTNFAVKCASLARQQFGAEVLLSAVDLLDKMIRLTEPQERVVCQTEKCLA